MRAFRKGIFCIMAVLLAMGAQLRTYAAQTREPDPSVPLKITAIDFGEEGWGDGTMIESNGECMLMDTFMPDCEDALKEFLLLPVPLSCGPFRQYASSDAGRPL